MTPAELARFAAEFLNDFGPQDQTASAHAVGTGAVAVLTDADGAASVYAFTEDAPHPNGGMLELDPPAFHRWLDRYEAPELAPEESLEEKAKLAKQWFPELSPLIELACTKRSA